MSDCFRRIGYCERKNFGQIPFLLPEPIDLSEITAEEQLYCVARLAHGAEVVREDSPFEDMSCLCLHFGNARRETEIKMMKRQFYLLLQCVVCTW